MWKFYVVLIDEIICMLAVVFLITAMSTRLVRIAPFANRLSMYVPPDIQYLRCLANYKSLKFASPISTLAKKLIKRMMEKSPRTGGKYVSVHLRFEEVCMVCFKVLLDMDLFYQILNF